MKRLFIVSSLLLVVFVCGCNVVANTTVDTPAPSTTSPSLATISIAPSSKTMTVGSTQTFTASGVDSSGNSIAVSPTWTVTGSIGTITTSGTFSTTTAGSGKIKATSGSIVGESSVVVVTLSTITVSPSSKTLSIGDAQTFSASGTDSSGNPITITPTWSVTGGIGTISSSGVFAATTAGSGMIKATSGSIVGESSVVVNTTAAGGIVIGNNFVFYDYIDGYSYLLTGDGKYIGDITHNKYATNSIMNAYGSYGSIYASLSITNTYGSYGSPYATYSAYNPYTSTPPIIVFTLSGSPVAIAYLTKNSYLFHAIDPDLLIAYYNTK